MTPDKIYVKEFYGEISQMWSSIKAIETTANVQHEYIRKDALLDFLTSLEKDSARNAGTDDLAYAAHGMVCLLIDKIKSL